MAIRQNPALPNRHTGYLASSGYGKSQALKQNREIPSRGARVLLWDIDQDHRATHFDNIKAFKQAVIAGMRSGKGFRIAWSGDTVATVNKGGKRQVIDVFEEVFCQVAWACLDGEIPLYIVIEELADVQASVGKASHNFGVLCRRARKYNGRIHWTSQRAEEVSKTVYSQTLNYYIGFPNDTCTPQQAEKLARLAKCPARAEGLYALKPLQFFYKDGSGRSRLVSLKYKKS